MVRWTKRKKLDDSVSLRFIRAQFRAHDVSLFVYLACPAGCVGGFTGLEQGRCSCNDPLWMGRFGFSCWRFSSLRTGSFVFPFGCVSYSKKYAVSSFAPSGFAPIGFFLPEQQR